MDAGDRGLEGRGGVRPRAGLRRGLAARRQARGRQGRPPGARGEEDRPSRPGQQLDLALREHDARGPRGVRRPALARDQAAAGPARQLLRRRARAQRAPAGPGLAPAGPPPRRRVARGRVRAHPGGAAGARRRAHAARPQAGGAGARAAAQLPQGPRQVQAPPAPQVRRDGRGRLHGAGSGSTASASGSPTGPTTSATSCAARARATTTRSACST